MKNNSLSKVSTSAAKFAGKAEFTIKKNSPEILLGAGIVGFVGTIVLACRATCRADEVLEFHRRKIKDINDAKEIADADPEGEMSYDIEIYRQDKAIRYLKTTGNLAKLYAPTVAVGALSLACILTSRNIMQKRYLGVVAAYNGLSAAFEEYRKRVRDEYGEGLDKPFRWIVPQFLFVLVGFFSRAKIYCTSRIMWVAKNIFYGIRTPQFRYSRFCGMFYSEFIIVANGRFNFSFVKNTRNLSRSRSLHTKIKDFLHRFCRFFINNPFILVIRIFYIAERRNGAKMFS